MVQDSSQRHRLKALVSRQDQLIEVEVKYETGNKEGITEITLEEFPVLIDELNAGFGNHFSGQVL